MTLSNYVGRKATGRVIANGHEHPVQVKIVEVVGDLLRVVANDPWCSIDSGIDNEAWVAPVFDDMPVGESPLTGYTEEFAHEIELDL